MRRYLAVAISGNQYAVRFVYAGGQDLHVVGDCRYFTTFEEADNVARRIASEEFAEIAPAGEYVSNR